MTTRPDSAWQAGLSVEAIREHFPALRRRHGGEPVAYFDGPGGTQVPRRVVEAMSDYLIQNNANTHWVYPSSVETDAALHAARAALADFLGGRPEEIAFGANMTSLTFHLGRALGRRLSEGDDLDAAVGRRTRLVAIGAASNALGTISDVHRATAQGQAGRRARPSRVLAVAPRTASGRGPGSSLPLRSARQAGSGAEGEDTSRTV